MTSSKSTIRQHFEAMFICDARCDLLYVNEPLKPESHPAPLVYYGIGTEEVVFAARGDVPDQVRQQLGELATGSGTAEDCDTLIVSAKSILESHFQIGGDYSGPAFEFSEHAPSGTGWIRVDGTNTDVLAGDFDDTIPEIEYVQPCVASIVDGKAVAVCQTVRQTRCLVEAGVETVESFRGRGHGHRVVSGWASMVRREGRVPAYSTWWKNHASRRLAQRLGLLQYCVDVHVSDGR